VSRTNKILLTVVAFGVAVAAYYFLVLAPKREEVAKLDTDIAAAEVKLEQARQTLATYEAARESYKANYATLARLGKAVPADDDVRSLMVQLESAATDSGVEFEKIELGTGLAGGAAGPSTAASDTDQLASAPGAVPVSGGTLSAMPFSFNFTGGFFDLSTFFSKLERFVTVNNERLDVTGRLMRLESIAITPSSAGYPDMQAEIAAATYIVPPLEPVAGGPAVPDSAQAASTASADPGTTTTTAKAGAAQ
jgi:Tfp pilus assembly protein PilO